MSAAGGADDEQCWNLFVAGTVWATQCEHIESPYLICAHHLYQVLHGNMAAGIFNNPVLCPSCDKPVRLLQVIPYQRGD
jgi:hypothetical protein